ncbi:nucleoside-diphosphate-sugar epimerase,dTDP-glucose 4,6-dehydratase,ADP-L-glycero-D-mannoheptose-6-epimerase,ADP-glyceromanno-heptose 6-epimerase,NAD dependent epimerase/dehydratase family [[Clostridium] sordellii]|nr:nucleoside-diphosphate-sugar epimerase,dTDP-glucose 4,6-dehydratase,ADP-L-glycero-D-mannoheptose-6-epimerase,ADP-glyceromanno-heptose 6-epimerase,NAD dependent epimerase/dehydratase family [[Clostridium] sordellii] [Paeniclostridium sordellii]
MSRVHLNRKRGIHMKVLITGVNGFIGSNIYEGLKDEFDVLGISQSSESKICKNYISCDLTDKDKLEEVIESNNDIDIIIHCAALAHNKGNDLSKDRFMKVNYEVSKDLVDLSNKYLSLKKFIFLSTISVYGERIDKDVYVETDKCYPKSPYAIAKKKSEEYIEVNCKAPYYILRLAPVYSDEFRLNIKRRTELKGINYIVGDGSNKLSLCNVSNIVISVYDMIRGKVDENGIYNMADQEVYSFIDLINVNRISTIKIWIPKFCINILYKMNKFTINKQFIDENSIKLITNNIYSPAKINEKINIKYNLFE